ncbi:MAG: nuclear transport factor 2 family protein [Calditrichia bacterium]
MMDKTIEYLIEKDRIINTLNRLFIGTDNRDWAAVKSCFDSRILFDMPSLAGGESSLLSPDDIISGWEEGLKPLKAIHHQAGNFVVHIDGNEADAFCYGIAYHFLPNKTGKNTRTFVGSYDFHLKKYRDNWLIDRFKFNLKFIEGNPNLETS